MLAMQVAAQRAFPKEVSERVRLDFVVTVKAVRLEGEFFLESELH
jgi:hypothetical protein